MIADLHRWDALRKLHDDWTLLDSDPQHYDLYRRLGAILAERDGTNGSESEDLACAWSDYRRDFGASGAQQHKAFKAGWLAARHGDQSEPLR